MTPLVLEIPWRELVRAFAAFSEEPYSLFFDGAGDHPASRFSYIAADPIDVLEIGPDDTTDAIAAARALLAPFLTDLPPHLPPFSGGLAGLLSYELGARLDRLPRARRAPQDTDWPDLALGLYDCVAAFDHAARRAMIISWGWLQNGGVNADAAREKAQLMAARLGAPAPALDEATPWTQPAAIWSLAAYRARIQTALDYIFAGDCFQTNLSQRFGGALPDAASPFDLYQRLAMQSAAPFSAYWRGRNRALASNSPERLIRLSPRANGAQAEARPIKGTRPRGATPSEDAAMAAALQTSAKDLAENLMIVDLLRNDLSRVCAPGTVRAPSLFKLESFANVHHLVSTVTGSLRPGLDAFDLVKAVFPGGSVTGAPKIRAAEIIAELENEARGPYCGSLAWFGVDGAMDASILIRTIGCVQDNGHWSVSLRVGGGIVADSKPSEEAQESIDKAASMLNAFSAATP